MFFFFWGGGWGVFVEAVQETGHLHPIDPDPTATKNPAERPAECWQGWAKPTEHSRWPLREFAGTRERGSQEGVPLAKPGAFRFLDDPMDLTKSGVADVPREPGLKSIL